jgi:hypothetical protein
MMIFGYTLAQVQKFVVSAVFVVGAALALVLSQYDPSFTQALVALVGAVFAAAGVFLSKNHTPDDLSKAVAQLQGAAIFVVGYFTTVPTSTVEKITLLTGALLSGYLVYKQSNEPVPGG